MKRNIEKTRQLLQALVGLSIDFDKILQRISEIRPALEGVEGDKDEINELLRFVDNVMSDFQKKRNVIDEVRYKGETIIWNRQTVSPHLKRQVEELELSDCATGCIPIGVETIGELCQYSSSELASPANCYANEIKDALRIPYTLVLKPEDRQK
jgi:DNA-directed RNA polymerase alpha subunit